LGVRGGREAGGGGSEYGALKKKILGVRGGRSRWRRKRSWSSEGEDWGVRRGREAGGGGSEDGAHKERIRWLEEEEKQVEEEVTMELRGRKLGG